MSVLGKVAGGASLISSLYDIHKTAIVYSKKEYMKEEGDSIVECSIGAQKADRLSYKDTQRKNWIDRHAFLTGPREILGAIKGYVSGFVEGVSSYLPKLLLSAVAILPKKSEVIPALGVIGLAIMEGYDFIKNSTGIFQKTDYLKRK